MVKNGLNVPTPAVEMAPTPIVEGTPIPALKKVPGPGNKRVRDNQRSSLSTHLLRSLSEIFLYQFYFNSNFCLRETCSYLHQSSVSLQELVAPCS